MGLACGTLCPTVPAAVETITLDLCLFNGFRKDLLRGMGMRDNLEEYQARGIYNWLLYMKTDLWGVLPHSASYCRNYYTIASRNTGNSRHLVKTLCSIVGVLVVACVAVD